MQGRRGGEENKRKQKKAKENKRKQKKTKESKRKQKKRDDISMASPTRLYKVFGYITCGYTRLAFDAVKQTAATTSGRVGLHPESSDFPASPSYTEYADFKNWLAKGEGLAAAIPPYHTTSPACFDDDDNFIGGYTELREHFDDEYNS